MIFTVRVLQDGSGLPVPGVAVRIHEEYLRHACVDEDCRIGCSVVLREERTVECVTDAQGLASATFRYWICENRSGELFETVLPGRRWWGEVLESISPESYHGMIFTRAGPPADGADQILYVTAEADLAERFAPVLHRHPLDIQEGLADVNQSVRAPGTRLRGFRSDGSQVVCLDHNTDLHYLYQGCGDADSHSRGGTLPIYWELDIDDQVVHRGAPVGSRPLYFHVFPWPDGEAVIQYWSWYNMNDLRPLPGAGAYHEGDWECVALKVRYESGSWVPTHVNFYQHEGGITYVPSDCWWSPTREPTYVGMVQGYHWNRTHPHIWVAANSHASYNRWQAQMQIREVDHVWFTDLADFNIAGSCVGEHRYFEYDRLVGMGEFLSAAQQHGCHWMQGHYTGPFGPAQECEVLGFAGWFGRRNCPEDIPDIVCSALSGFPSLYSGARSPVNPEGNHEWRGFTLDLDGWGIPAAVQGPPTGNYLGRFLMCANGHEPLAFRVPSVAGRESATAAIHRLSGDVTFTHADADGHIHLPLQADGTYFFNERRVTGEGTVQIEILEESDQGPPGVCASRLMAEIVEWGPAQTPLPEPEPEFSARILPSVGPGPVRISYSRCVGAGISCQVLDAAGRIVDRIDRTCGDGAGEITWNPGRLAAGLYFLRVHNGREWVRAGKFTLVR